MKKLIVYGGVGLCFLMCIASGAFAQGVTVLCTNDAIRHNPITSETGALLPEGCLVQYITVEGTAGQEPIISTPDANGNPTDPKETLTYNKTNRIGSTPEANYGPGEIRCAPPVTVNSAWLYIRAWNGPTPQTSRKYGNSKPEYYVTSSNFPTYAPTSFATIFDAPQIPGPTWEVGTAESTTTIRWTWAAVTGTSTYELWNAGTNIFIMTVEGTSTVETLALPDTQATREVKAIVGGTLTAPSPVKTVYTLAAAPINLKAVSGWNSLNKNYVMVTWEANSNPGTVLYQLFRGTTPVSIKITGLTTKESNLPSSTECTYKVKAFNRANISTESISTSETTPPGKVISVTATALSSSQIRLTWPTTTGATSYVASMEDGTRLTTTEPGNTVVFTGLSANIEYTFTVAGVSSNGTGEPSVDILRYTLANVPINLKAVSGWNSLNKNYVMVTWEANSNPGGTQYQLFRGTTPINGKMTTLTTKESNLPSSTECTYTVKAFNGNNISVESSSTTETTAPGKVIGVIATALSTTEIQLTWPATTGANSYVASREDGTRIATVTRVATFSALTANTTHTFTVVAVNTEGTTGEPSTSLPKYTLAATPPPPTGEAGSTAYCVDLYWALGDINPGTTLYNIEYSTRESDSYVTTVTDLMAKNRDNVAANTYDDRLIWFRVIAKNGDGMFSAYSSAKQIRTKGSGIVPPAPAWLIGTAESTNKVRWTWQSSFDATSYELYNPVTSTITMTIDATAGSPNTTVEPVSPGYDLPNTREVRSLREGPTSPFSNPYIAYNLANKSIIDIVHGSWESTKKSNMYVSWEANGNPVTVKYQLFRAGNSIDGKTISYYSTTESILTPATTYTYEVRTFNRNDVSTSSATAMSVTPPYKVNMLPATALSTSEIQLTWQATSGATGYNAKSNTPAGTKTFNGQPTVVGTFDSLAACRQYTFTFEAFHSTYGTGEPSALIRKWTLPAKPVTPTGETASVAQKAADIFWPADFPNNNYLATYEVLYAYPNSTDAYTVAATTAAGALYKNDVVTPYGNANVWFKIRAMNGEGVYSATSEAVRVRTSMGSETAPAPAWLIGTAESTNKVRWTWQSSFDATSYELYNPVTSTITMTIDATGGLPNTTVETVTPGYDSPNTREVRSLREGPTSPFSTAYTAYNLANKSVIDIVNGSWESVKKSNMYVSWEANGNPVTVKYQLYRAGSSVFGKAASYYSTTEVNLTPATTYTYEVRTFNRNDVSTSSATVSDRTPPYKVVVVPGVVATNEITWTWLSTTDATSYKVRIDASTEVVGDIDPTSLATFETLTPSRKYTCTVEAISAYGTGEPSNPVAKWTLPAKPVTPTGETGTDPASVHLYWAPDYPNNNYQATYEVAWSYPSSAGPYTVVATTAARVQAIYNLAISGHGSQVVWFKIWARNGDGEYSVSSDAVSVLTYPEGAVAGPSWFNGTAESISSIMWTWDTVPFASRYELWDATHCLITMEGETKTFTLEGSATLGTLPNTYAYRRVKAIVSGVSSNFSPNLPKYTLANRPSPVSANGSWESTKRNNVSVSWGSNTNQSTVQYRLYNVTRAGTVDGVISGVTGTITTFEPGLTPNNIYTYEVRAYNSENLVTISARATDWTPPGKVTVSSGYVATNEIMWTWVGTLGADSYRAKIDGVLQTVNSPTVWVTSESLTPSSRHICTVEAASTAYGTGEPSAAFVKWALPAAPPAPQGGPSYVYANSFDVYWLTDTNTTAAYSVEFCTTESTGPYTTVEPMLTDKQTHVDVGITTPECWFRIRARNSEGVTSEYSPPALLAGGYIPPPPEIAGPVISQVKFNGRNYTTGMLVATKPIITAIVTGGAGVADVDVARTSQCAYIDPGTASEIILAASDCTYEVTPGAPPYTYTLTIVPSVAIPAHPVSGHRIRIYSWDKAGHGNTSFWEGTVAVMSGGVQVIGPVYNYPNPFKPLSSKPDENKTRIAYNLSVDANITVIIYDMTGHEVHKATYRSGSTGGQAGVNSVEWNGHSLFGEAVGNGMYVYKIITGDRVVASGKLVVYD